MRINNRRNENHIDIQENYLLESAKVTTKTYSWMRTSDRGDYGDLASCE